MNQKTSEIDEQIAQLIASLPSSRLLQQAKTPAQIEEWHKARQTQILLAECLFLHNTLLGIFKQVTPSSLDNESVLAILNYCLGKFIS
jgi:hypothetical protein